MQEKLYQIITHVTVAAITATVTYFTQRHIYNKQKQEEIQQIKAAYKKRDEERQKSLIELKTAPSEKLHSERVPKVVGEASGETIVSYTQGMPDPDKAPIKQEAGYVDYTKFKNNGRLDKMEVTDTILDRDISKNWREAMTPRENLAYVITDNQYANDCLTYNKVELTYYCQDEVWLDEGGDIIEISTAYIPEDHDDLFGCESGDVDLLYTRNDNLKTDVEVRRMWARYSDVISGIAFDDEDDEDD